MAAVVVDNDAARREARHILSGGQFHASPTPRPFRKPLAWLGDRLAPIGRALGRVVSAIPLGVWLMIAAVAIAVAIALIVSKRRAVGGHADARRRANTTGAETAEDPDELERAAVEAERCGDLEQALRLRFRAGLLRLGRRGAIEYRPSLTTGEVRRALGSQTFDDLARTFEEVAYGGREAGPPDLDTARREWPRVVTGASNRSDR